MPKPTLAAGGRLAWSVAGGYIRLLCRVAAVVAVGLVANWGFIALAAWHSGGSTRLLSGAAILVTFGLLFPIGYLVTGQKQGGQVLLRHCFERHRSSLTNFLLLMLQRLLAGEGEKAITALNIRLALRRVEGMPWAIRFALKRHLHRQELQALMLLIISDPDFQAGRLAVTKERFEERITCCILDTLLEVDHRSFRILAGVNAVAFAAAWALLR